MTLCNHIKLKELVRISSYRCPYLINSKLIPTELMNMVPIVAFHFASFSLYFNSEVNRFFRG